MPNVIVLGAGVCGLTAALLLARDGHEVTVLERDPDPVPESPAEAWEHWERAGVRQFRQAHFLQARGRQVLEEGLPDVRDELLSAGALQLDPLARMPPTIADRVSRPGDERLATLTARRPTIEQVLGRAAEVEPRVEVRRGVAVRGLETCATSDGVPHVIGVRTEAGEALTADLVLDAMGRRSPLPAWLADAGARPLHEEAEDSGFVYYTRFFRSENGGGIPEPRAALLSTVGSLSILTLPSDAGTWSVTVFGASHDRPLKRLRHADRWSAVVAACPLHAHWLDGDPITGVLSMGGVLDRHRRLVVDGRPVVTGVALLADAAACTNPSLGRGMALGMAHADLLPGVIDACLEDPGLFTEAWDDATEQELVPWYRATVATDRDRLAELGALREGRPAPAPADPAAALRAALPRVMGRDAELFRAGLEITSCMTLPQDVFARPGLAERVLELSADADALRPPPGPGREELLRLLA